MSDTGALAAFLSERLRSAIAWAGDDPCDCAASPGGPCRGRADCPEYVRRDVEAKRRRLDRHTRIPAIGPAWCAWCSRGDYVEAWPCPDLANDALSHIGHKDFKPEWRQIGERTEWRPS